MKNLTWRRVSLALLVCALAASASGRSWQSDAFRANEARATRLLLLPPSSSITRAKVNDAEPLFDESGVLELELARAVTDSLRGLGYEVDATSATVERQGQDRELQAAVSRLEARVAEVMQQVSYKPRQIRDGRYTVEDAGLPLREATGAEAVLLLESQTVIPSKGVKALGAILGGAYYNPTQTMAIGILVDLRSGVIDSVMVGSSLGAAVKRPGKVADAAVASMLSGHPRRGEAKKVKASRRARAAEADRDEDDADEEEAAVLAEFESLRTKRRADTPAPAADPVPEPEPEPEPENPAELVLPAREFQSAAGGASVAAAETAPPASTPVPAPTPTVTVRAAPPTATVTSPSPVTVAPVPPVRAAATAPAAPQPRPPVAAPAPPREEARRSGAPAPAPLPTRTPPPVPLASPVQRPPAPSPVVPPPADDAEARALYQAPPPAHPAVDVAFTGGEGGPGVIVVNGTGLDLRVSVGFRAFRPLAPGETARVDAARGTAWILVTDPARRELARAACTVGENSLVTVDLTTH